MIREDSYEDFVDITQFTYCCGCAELGSFTGTAKEIGFAIKGYLHCAMIDHRVSIYTAITHDAQQRPAVKALQSLGFARYKFRNKKTGHKLSFWFLHAKE